MPKQLLRVSQVQEMVGFSRSQIYRLIALNGFPPPIQLGTRAVAWDRDVVEAWIRLRIATPWTRGRVGVSPETRPTGTLLRRRKST